ncbi:MAG TPA: MoxR family ATPase [Gammaproteobacteria bacterium]|nr:MoxR family ATPase [Gammaproteobacteria bacterium]
MSASFQAINNFLIYLDQRIIGQSEMTKRLFIALLADGHLIVEGAPGLAKTTAIKILAEGLEGDFHRVQFTPDLLPADLTGTEIYRPQDGSFRFQQGPLFHNLLLADEINRAPAKVQSALLEAMGERQITVGRTTYRLPELFLVMATQNPIEQEGTYPLPEAQLDRFLMHINIDYPSVESEKKILKLVRDSAHSTSKKFFSPPKKLTQKMLFKAREEVLDIHMSDAIEEYIVQLIAATRNAGAYGDDMARWVMYGASPRGTIALDRCSRAYAWISGRDYVAPEDIHAIAPNVLRHRVLLTFEAEAEGITPDQFIQELINRVPVP